MIQKKDLYSVYTHTSPSGKVYVGISNNPKRRWGTYGAPYLCKSKSGNYAQSCFANAIIKYGWNNFKHEILLKDVSFSEALYAEKYLIRWYKIHHISYNMSDGGEWFSGSRKPLSEKRRQQVKEFMQNHHPMKGRHHTDEAKSKMAEAAKNRKYTNEQKAIISKKISIANKGKHRLMSEEDRKRISLISKELHEKGLFPHNTKEVHQYDFKGNYITSYPSIKKAAETIQRGGGDISSCANGKTLSVGGYIWTYKKVNHIDTSCFVVFKNKLYTKDGYKRRISSNVKAVNQYTIEGKYIATYASIREATKNTPGSKSGISSCCQHKVGAKRSGGYLWEYDNGSNRVDIVL